MVIGGAADKRQVVDRRSGTVLATMNLTNPAFDQAAIANLAEVCGVSLEELELRDVPGTWDIPAD